MMMMMMMMMNDDDDGDYDDDDGFHIALFSALEQTHCAFCLVLNHVWLGMNEEVVVFYCGTGFEMRRSLLKLQNTIKTHERLNGTELRRFLCVRYRL